MDSTGLYYYNARYYDPVIGRFISPDIYVQDYANPQILNRYSYVRNNPLKYTDPTGWWTWGHGFNLSLVFGVGFSFDVLKVQDDKGNKAWAVSLSFIGGTPSASVGYQYQFTSADTVNNLAKWSGGAGASTGYIPTPVPSGIEYVGYKRNQEGGWEGYNINIGPQAAPVEVHAVAGYTFVLGTKDEQPQLPSTNKTVDTASPQPSYPSFDWSYYYYYNYNYIPPVSPSSVTSSGPSQSLLDIQTRYGGNIKQTPTGEWYVSL